MVKMQACQSVFSFFKYLFDYFAFNKQVAETHICHSDNECMFTTTDFHAQIHIYKQIRIPVEGIDS